MYDDGLDIDMYSHTYFEFNEVCFSKRAFQGTVDLHEFREKLW